MMMIKNKRKMMISIVIEIVIDQSIVDQFFSTQWADSLDCSNRKSALIVQITWGVYTIEFTYNLYMPELLLITYLHIRQCCLNEGEPLQKQHQRVWSTECRSIKSCTPYGYTSPQVQGYESDEERPRASIASDAVLVTR